MLKANFIRRTVCPFVLVVFVLIAWGWRLDERTGGVKQLWLVIPEDGY